MTYGAVITACQRGGQWERALSVLDKMKKTGVTPNLITYAALLMAPLPPLAASLAAALPPLLLLTVVSPPLQVQRCDFCVREVVKVGAGASPSE